MSHHMSFLCMRIEAISGHRSDKIDESSRSDENGRSIIISPTTTRAINWNTMEEPFSSHWLTDLKNRLYHRPGNPVLTRGAPPSPWHGRFIPPVQTISSFEYLILYTFSQVSFDIKVIAVWWACRVESAVRVLPHPAA